jgi:hypothetical protein
MILESIRFPSLLKQGSVVLIVDRFQRREAEINSGNGLWIIHDHHHCFVYGARSLRSILSCKYRRIHSWLAMIHWSAWCMGSSNFVKSQNCLQACQLYSKRTWVVFFFAFFLVKQEKIHQLTVDLFLLACQLFFTMRMGREQTFIY